MGTLRTRVGYALLFAPVAALLVVAFFLPLGEVFGTGLRADGRLSLSRIWALLRDPYIQHLLTFTVEQALISTAISLALGFPLGWLLARYRFRGRGLLRALTLVPFVLPPITVALGFVLFFGHSGYLNRALMGLFGLPTPPLRVLYSMWGIVLAHAFYNAPVFARFVAAAWEGMDPEPVEAAWTLGASPLRAFTAVVLPGLLPAIASAFSLVFIFCFLSFAIPLTLGGARYATLEVGVYLYARVLLRIPDAAALALVELFISLALAYLYIRGGGTFTARDVSGRTLPRAPLFSRPAHALWAVYLAGAAIFFIGPIGAVVADSFLRDGPTLKWYAGILSGSGSPFIGTSPLGAVGTGLLVATVSASGALILGLAISWGLRHIRSAWLRGVAETVLLVPLAVSSVVLGLALLLAFRRPPLSPLRGTPWGIALAHTLLFYPFVVRLIRPLWDSIDPALVEAARTLGAGELRAFIHVEAPLLARGISAAWAFAFALSLGEMTAVAMLARPGLTTIPLAIYRLIGGRRFGEASAMATVLIVVTVAAILLWERLAARPRFGEGD